VNLYLRNQKPNGMRYEQVERAITIGVEEIVSSCHKEVAVID